MLVVVSLQFLCHVAQSVDEGTILEATTGATGGDYMKHLLIELENDPAGAVVKLVSYVRSDDYRLVRVKISAESRGKQTQFMVADGIHLLLKMLGSDFGPRQHAYAAEALHLLVSENPDMAQLFGLQSWLPGAYGIKELIAFVQRGTQDEATLDEILAAEEASEAIWALTQSSVDNLEMAVDKGAIDVFADSLESGGSPRLRMWAGVVLKKLLADIYHSPDGGYRPNARRVMDNKKARKRVAERPRFVETLKSILKSGRVDGLVPRSEWPSLAAVSAREASCISAWAAAACISSLALSPDNHEVLRAAEVSQELCVLRKSPDNLEKVAAEAALQALGEDCGDVRSEL